MRFFVQLNTGGGKGAQAQSQIIAPADVFQQVF